jgi:Domain of unknown function (DUF4337)
MAEAAEIPEAKDPFEKAVAVSIAIMAVVLSVIANRGDDAKTDAIIKTNEAANKWGYFQAKSIKQHVYDTTLKSLSVLNAASADQAKLGELSSKLNEELKRYDQEKGAIKTEAEHLETEAKQQLSINNRSDFGALLLQIAIVMASIAILSRWKSLWVGGIILGLAGAGVGLSAFFL